MAVPDVVIVGAGVFGVTAALELKRRGARVTLVDPGPLPHPLAASTDISKVVRIEYAGDPLYTRLAVEARQGWLAWNQLFEEPLYHEVGLLLLTSQPMQPGEYEYENLQALQAGGFSPQKLDQAAIEALHPVFNPAYFLEGYFNPAAGYAESGRVVQALLHQAQVAGVVLRPGVSVTGIEVEAGRLIGLHTSAGHLPTNSAVIAAGAWTPTLLPELGAALRADGMPVFHLKPADESLFLPPGFPVFSADVTRTGWYGFPLHPREGVVKLAHHGAGVSVTPAEGIPPVTEGEAGRLRAFLQAAVPPLAAAEIVRTRRCLYCDTPDEDFWIAPHPHIAGLTVAAGDSGHGFKFAPLLGGLIADACQGLPNPALDRFRWRSFDQGPTRREASRFHESL